MNHERLVRMAGEVTQMRLLCLQLANLYAVEQLTDGMAAFGNA
jgi:hypothetical protein